MEHSEIKPLLKQLGDSLVDKNVSNEIVAQICDSVAN